MKIVYAMRTALWAISFMLGSSEVAAFEIGEVERNKNAAEKFLSQFGDFVRSYSRKEDQAKLRSIETNLEAWLAKGHYVEFSWNCRSEDTPDHIVRRCRSKIDDLSLSSRHRAQKLSRLLTTIGLFERVIPEEAEHLKQANINRIMGLPNRYFLANSSICFGFLPNTIRCERRFFTYDPVLAPSPGFSVNLLLVGDAVSGIAIHSGRSNFGKLLSAKNPEVIEIDIRKVTAPNNG